MKGIAYNNKDLSDLKRICKSLFPEFIEIEFERYRNSIIIIFRKAARNSLVNLLASDHVKKQMSLTEFLLTVLPERLSIAKSRNTSYVSQYLFEAFAVLASDPEYLLKYFITKFDEIREPMSKESFDEILARIAEAKVEISKKESDSIIGKLITGREASLGKISILAIAKNVNKHY